MACYDDRNAPK